jgi:shikimate kinase
MADTTLHKLVAADAQDRVLLRALGNRSIVLVGMMGAGKSSVGRRLSARLGIPFVDADCEIEARAGMTIPEYFERHGEDNFRSGEARVIANLLNGGPQVLATGGGAFMNPDTRAAIRRNGVSVWLKADFDVLLRRVRRRHDRPMLKTANPAETLRHLMAVRDPVYAEADVTVASREVPHETIVSETLRALIARVGDSSPQSGVPTGASGAAP